MTPYPDQKQNTTFVGHFPTLSSSTGLMHSFDGDDDDWDVVVYKDGIATPITAGITRTKDFASYDGLNQVEIDLSASASYTPVAVVGSSFVVVISEGDVDGVSWVGVPVISFTSGKLMTQAELAAALQVESGGFAQLTATDVADQYTFKVGSEGTVSRNIVSVKAWSTGTKTFAFDFSEILQQSGSAIDAVTSVTVAKVGAPTVTTSNLRKHQQQMIAMWETSAILSANAGTYTVTVTIVTFDSNTIVVTGTLEVE